MVARRPRRRRRVIALATPCRSQGRNEYVPSRSSGSAIGAEARAHAATSKWGRTCSCARQRRIGRHGFRDVILRARLAGERGCLGMEDLVRRLERHGERLVGYLRPRPLSGFSLGPVGWRRASTVEAALPARKVAKNTLQMAEVLDARRFGLGIHHREVVTHRAGDGGRRSQSTGAGQFDSAVLRNESGLRELGGIVEVAELRRRELLLAGRAPWPGRRR